MFEATSEQARRLADLCIGRQSDYALQTAAGRYRRVGLPVSLSVVQSHLAGSCTMGTYLMDEQGQCFFAVFDADQAQGLEQLATLRRRLAGEGIPSYLEASRRGGHLWVFLDTPAPAWAVRAWLLPCTPPGVEFYPKQDEASGVGSLMRVPLGLHQRSGRRYPFLVERAGQLVPVASSLAETLAALDQVQRATVPQALFTAYRISREAAKTPHTSQTQKADLRGTSSASTIAAWCAQQEPFTLIGRYVRLDSRGMGHCPFGDHHQQGKDHHPSFQVFAPKQRGGTCWRCYAGQISGNVFNFLQQYHRLNAQELWVRLRRGEVL